ncbi:PfkB family carbohydrate kinase [Candidatus Protofrankia californiensis]|uniref:PfkB family carbohydrate kinase n=1 Tax=Candidatus Protofrankia californiensis TaxID=1839754 RepID=UPI00104167D7|nr:PfkB family carbohydrate kinase [Candidatus Protofrankia californiensis]
MRAWPVEVVDTTAANDAFTAALAFHLTAGSDSQIAVYRALQAAAVTVTRPGSYEALPTVADLASIGRADKATA